MRCPTALIRPRALAGTLNPSVFDLTDQSGFTMQKAMEDFGLSPDAAVNLRRHAAGILGYAEVHIEQDPVSETASQSVGIAAGICGISQFFYRRNRTCRNRTDCRMQERYGCPVANDRGHHG